MKKNDKGFQDRLLWIRGHMPQVQGYSSYVVPLLAIGCGCYDDWQVIKLKDCKKYSGMRVVI